MFRAVSLAIAFLVMVQAASSADDPKVAALAKAEEQLKTARAAVEAIPDLVEKNLEERIAAERSGKADGNKIDALKAELKAIQENQELPKVLAPEVKKHRDKVNADLLKSLEEAAKAYRGLGKDDQAKALENELNEIKKSGPAKPKNEAANAEKWPPPTVKPTKCKWATACELANSTGGQCVVHQAHRLLFIVDARGNTHVLSIDISEFPDTRLLEACKAGMQKCEVLIYGNNGKAFIIH